MRQGQRPWPLAFYSSDLHQAAEDRRALEEDLRDALVRGEMELGYQPVVHSRSNMVTGVEALVRWTHPDRGLISPAVFIPIAEEANLIWQLGEWVLRRACEDASRWPGDMRVAVNVSPIQFANPDLPKIVANALAATGLAPTGSNSKSPKACSLATPPKRAACSRP